MSHPERARIETNAERMPMASAAAGEGTADHPNGPGSGGVDRCTWPTAARAPLAFNICPAISNSITLIFHINVGW
jgi:hypothetical protein